ncbi:MAG: hypothetical protein M5U14_19975 [Acidimicrobiia bacterium]|nr:hypothetical protein [Acidimicrobiia bacterium]
MTFEALDDRFRRGGVLKATQLTEEYDFAVFQSRYGDAALPLFRLEDGSLEVFAADGALRPRPGDVLVSVIDAAALDETGPRASPAGRRRAAKAEGEPGPPGAEPKRAPGCDP